MVAVGLLMAAASACGLLFGDLYRDNLLVSSGWIGNDLITLVVAVPMLAVSSAYARRGSPRGALVRLGLLDYALYTYAFYLFGAAFNALFLVYAAIVTLSAAALICGLASLNVSVFAAGVGRRGAAVARVWTGSGLFSTGRGPWGSDLRRVRAET